MTNLMPNKSRACVKSADTKFGNDQILSAWRFDETSRWIGWSKNEFSHSLALQPTATSLAVLRMIILHFHPFGFAQPWPRSSWLWLSSPLR
jgi:hypothetical protein